MLKGMQTGTILDQVNAAVAALVVHREPPEPWVLRWTGYKVGVDSGVLHGQWLAWRRGEDLSYTARIVACTGGALHVCFPGDSFDIGLFRVRGREPVSIERVCSEGAAGGVAVRMCQMALDDLVKVLGLAAEEELVASWQVDLARKYLYPEELQKRGG